MDLCGYPLKYIMIKNKKIIVVLPAYNAEKTLLGYPKGYSI
jgi:hypothetical protein